MVRKRGHEECGHQTKHPTPSCQKGIEFVEGRVRTFIVLGESAVLHMDLFKLLLGERPPNFFDAPSVEVWLVFVSHSVDLVEVPTNKPLDPRGGLVR